MFGLPLMPLVLLGAGLFDLILALGIHLFLNRLKQRTDLIRRKWRPVTVKILSSRLVETTDSEGTTYSAEVRYEYTVDGTRHESDRISIYPRWSSSQRGDHLKVVEGYPSGTEQQGWVNPWKPEEAVLDTTALPPGNFRLILVILVGSGIALLLAGAIVGLVGGGAPA